MASEHPQFDLGAVVATPGALSAFMEAEQDPTVFLIRHIEGDWGELDREDWQLNDNAISAGGRILSAYVLSTGVKFWIITEADRSATTFLLPEEY